MKSDIKTKTISVGARSSNLSKAQVKEVLQELHKFHPEITFDPIYIKTTGDIDLKTSLREVNQTDFFTKEIDEMLLNKKCRIAIHSAKDLPSPLPKGLFLAAITKGVDSSDSLVLRDEDSIETLPPQAIIATSSKQREERVRKLRNDLSFTDLRGTIEKRLEKLISGQADGVVIAEAALIRLGLTHYKRIKLPGETTLFQGKLAVVCRSGDKEMINLFSCIDIR